jgi:hypothetical protein
MAALQTFDQALSNSAAADGDAWSDDGVVLVGQLAGQLSDEELALLRAMWSDRPLLWQKHCAQVLGWARHGEAIEILMDQVDRAPQEVALPRSSRSASLTLGCSLPRSRAESSMQSRRCLRAHPRAG